MTTSTRARPDAPGWGLRDAGWVALFAANNWDDIRLSDRPLAEALAAYVDVLYVDPPLSRLTPRHHPRLAPALDGPRLRPAAPGIVRLTPVVTPLPFRRAVLPLTRLLVRRSAGRALRAVRQHTGREATAVVSTLLDIDVFDLAPTARHAYWAQDDVAAGAELWGQDRVRLLAGERRVAGRADLVLLASPTAAVRWSERVAHAVAFPNGCDSDRLATPPAAVPDTGGADGAPVAGFVGHLNRRTDLALLERLADERVTVLLVGPIGADVDGARLERLLSRRNVRSVGPQPAEGLPGWLAAMDVGLVPYRNDDFNRGSFPLKTLEYLAAGLPVVSTGLPASRWLASPDVTLADGPAEFAAAVVAAAAGPGTADDVVRRRRFAAAHSWDARARQLVDLLGDR